MAASTAPLIGVEPREFDRGQSSLLTEEAPSIDAGLTPRPARVRFADLDAQQRQKVLWKERVVQAVDERIDGGLSQRQAIIRTLALPEFCQASASRVRSWRQAYAADGLDGLVEQKKGTVGRKSIASVIPRQVLDQAAAAAVEHGTLGRDGRQNIARAYRNVVVSNPDLPAEARAQIHGDHASKSYVPRSVMDAVRVSPIARDIVRGPKAAKLGAPFQPCTYDDVPPGRVITADDMTANVYCWMEHPSANGYIVGRPQILAFLDVGALRWQLARVILRQSGAYTRDDVWGCVGDVMETFGVYPEWLFEGGRLWRSNRVIGERTGLSEDDRFGGLRALGCTLHHSRRPQSKHVEQGFNELQYEVDRCQGFAGRDERLQSEEHVQAAIAGCKAGKIHPRGIFPHVSEFAQHVEACMGSLNEERNDGKILRGQTPNEAWATDATERAALPANAAWMFRSNVSRTKVRRDGRVHVALRSGKYREDYYYAAPDLLQPRAGQSVLVYWNDRNPEADACILTAGQSPSFLGLAEYVEPVPRFDATDEQMAESASRRKAAIAAARSEIVRMKPHFERQPAPTLSPSTQSHQPVSTAADVYTHKTQSQRDQSRGRGTVFDDVQTAMDEAERSADALAVQRDCSAAAMRRVDLDEEAIDEAMNAEVEECLDPSSEISTDEFIAAIGGSDE